VAVQPTDGKVLIAGKFTQVDRQPFAGIARFNNDKKFIPVTEDIKITSVEQVGNGIVIHIQTQPGFTYAVEASKDFVTWVTVKTITATGPVSEFTEPFSDPSRFYRVRRVSP